MLYGLELNISYQFNRPTGGGRQLLRVMPAQIPGQQDRLESALRISPDPLEQRQFTDFFGNEVIEIIHAPGLSAMEVKMHAKVQRHTPPAPGKETSAPLALYQMKDALAQVQDVSPHSPWHYLNASPHIPHVPAIADFAQRSTATCTSVPAAIESLGRALFNTITFDANATEVDTPISVAFALRKGVCQDFAQIMICGLRALGIPSGYVGGYLRTHPPKGQPRLIGADAMHAWTRAWTGPDSGWVEFDATNNTWAGYDHIQSSYGRDYGDIAPVTGTLRLDGGQTGSHRVDILAEEPECDAPNFDQTAR